ncbi:PREDICTED: elongation factor 1-delta-like [Ipomoea nil]|uniref:elongation factor 1-delta-like n=1 Tax=Ipomoea nil TaxID=35883 RepID=UPI0009016567|nr:PREDICTED: elongation factor 1-delta-like [Ipomoea nil]
MAVTFYNLNSDAGLKKLDEYLLTRSYITGYQASKDDITVYSSLPKPPSSEYVNVSRWYKHIDALLRISGVSGEGCGVTIEGSAPIPAGVVTPPAADTKAVEERVAVIKASSKTKESGKSSVLLDVKPWDDETDMKKLEEAVRSVSMEGLLWGASKLVPVGSGIKKLRIMLTIVDDLVSVDELIENYLTVEPVNEYVQSCDLVAFHKICKLTCPSILLLINGYKV